MPLMNDQTREEVKKLLEMMDKPVKLELYTMNIECGLCKETHELLAEIAALNPKIYLEVHEQNTTDTTVSDPDMEKLPAILMKGEKDYGIRFFGIPAGYEFTAFMSSLLLVSRGELYLKPTTKAFLDTLKQPVHIEVITSPTCPYCPGMVMIAHQMAFYSQYVTGDMIEISEFPILANKYKVEGVPKTAINGTHFVDGAVPEDMLVDKIKEALNV